MVLAQEGPARQRNLWRGGETLRHARTCYDHMAGRIAVAIADRLAQQSFILLDEDGGQLTDAGRSFFDEVGVDLRLTSKRRVFCRPCLDWSERRPHLAGAVGAAILRHALDHDWVEHVRDSRALVVTPVGVSGLATTFGIDGAPPRGRPRGVHHARTKCSGEPTNTNRSHDERAGYPGHARPIVIESVSKNGSTTAPADAAGARSSRDRVGRTLGAWR